jgi:sigma-B regulation protein RsbQ
MEADVLRKHNVNVLGTGDTTVVLAHGFGADQTVWKHQVAALGPQYRLVLFDYLGCGKTDPREYNPLRYDSMERYADDVIAIHDALGLPWTAFVGHSASGMIGLLASLARPDIVRHLVLLGASPRYLNETGYVGGFERPDLDGLYDAMARDYLAWANGFAPAMMGDRAPPSVGEDFARTLGSMRPDIAQSVARVIFESDFRAKLPLAKVPVHVLQTRRDPAVPVEVGRYLTSHIPGARLVMLDAEGHLPHMSAPQHVDAALLELLAHAA